MIRTAVDVAILLVVCIIIGTVGGLLNAAFHTWVFMPITMLINFAWSWHYSGVIIKGVLERSAREKTNRSR